MYYRCHLLLISKYIYIYIYVYIVLWRRQWHPTPVLLPGKSHGWRSLVGCSPCGRKESDRTEWLHFHFSLSCIGKADGNPLQCSCLENPRDGEGEPRGLLSLGSHRVGHDWNNLAYSLICIHTHLRKISELLELKSLLLLDHSWLIFRGTLSLSHISLGLFPLNIDRHTVPCMQKQLNKQELQEVYLKSNSWNTHVIKINCWKLTIYIQVHDALLAAKFRLITPTFPVLPHDYTLLQRLWP